MFRLGWSAHGDSLQRLFCQGLRCQVGLQGARRHEGTPRRSVQGLKLCVYNHSNEMDSRQLEGTAQRLTAVPCVWG